MTPRIPRKGCPVRTPLDPAYEAPRPLATATMAMTAHADDHSVTYHRFGGDVYGSDGSRIHRFSGDTYITDKHGHETKCHEFAGKVTCPAISA